MSANTIELVFKLADELNNPKDRIHGRIIKALLVTRKHCGLSRIEMEKVMINELHMDLIYVRKRLKRSLNVMVEKGMLTHNGRWRYKLIGFGRNPHRADKNLGLLFFNDLEDSIRKELVRRQLAGELLMKLKHLK